MTNDELAAILFAVEEAELDDEIDEYEALCECCEAENASCGTRAGSVAWALEWEYSN